VVKTIERFLEERAYRPDVLVTFAFPLVDHIIGLQLKKRLELPWLAHFSDPWVDNPFKKDDWFTRALNAYLERGVIEQADRVVFTSRETADLVMKKYEPSLQAKVRVVPHAFEPALFPSFHELPSGPIVIRYLGDLYLSRTPRPLFEALKRISSLEPDLVKKFRFEIVGDVQALRLEEMGLSTLPEGLVVLRPRVGYRDSLSLMRSASGLMVVDAPVASNTKSVFLPSKLIEYLGAGRPIIGLTPPGTAADLISDLGGWVADPGDAHESANVMQKFLSFLLEQQNNPAKDWGRSEVRKKFEVKVVARQFQEILAELL
jgi:glycosyltransferase involved in cell wall biosynthesis